MSGPAASGVARRRNRTEGPEVTWLPAEGRKGKAPAWPLSTPRVAGWAEIWRSPQAVMWESGGIGTIHAVARYLIVREAVYEVKDLREHGVGVLLTELGRLETSLGITPQAMRRLRWVVEPTLQSVGEPLPSSGVASIDQERRRRLMQGK